MLGALAASFGVEENPRLRQQYDIRVAAIDASAIKAWRECLRLTRAELAARLGITQAAFAQMESARRPRKATLQKVAEALGLELQ